MLSEERINEIVMEQWDAWSKEAKRGMDESVALAMMQDAAREAADEAASTERDRSRELVCASCGRSTVGGYVMCDADSCDGDGTHFVARAEHERRQA